MLGTALSSAARGAMRLLAGRLARRKADVPVARAVGPRPMPVLRPPAAVNDNPLAALQSEIERDLRARGYLR